MRILGEALAIATLSWLSNRPELEIDTWDGLVSVQMKLEALTRLGYLGRWRKETRKEHPEGAWMHWH